MVGSVALVMVCLFAARAAVLVAAARIAPGI
jgi:hypothetical protein